MSFFYIRSVAKNLSKAYTQTPILSTYKDSQNFRGSQRHYTCVIGREATCSIPRINQPRVMESDPPFHETFKTLFSQDLHASANKEMVVSLSVEERELPLIDLSQLSSCEADARRRCKLEIARASRDWGFFQVVNHGVSKEVLEAMRREQVKLFRQPFEWKVREDKFMNFSPGSYRWGTPTATCAKQFSWSEAFHVPLADILASSHPDSGKTQLSLTMEHFSATVSNLAQTLTAILVENLGHKSDFITDSCVPSSCYLRLNRYPPCPISSMFGLMPHTDSDFLTILHQDHVGGLQLIKDGQWIAVKPNPDALIINIGDLFQAWSNDVYKSVEHRVVTNPTEERFSTAYFLCPSYDTEIKSCGEPSVYRNFSFRKYRQQVQVDVKNLGHKIGLPRFLCTR